MGDVERVTLTAEELDLPATATIAQMKEAIVAMKTERNELRAERDEWRKRAEDTQAQLVEAKKTAAENKVLKGKLVVQAARDLDKIDESEQEFYLELYEKDPKLCEKRLDALRSRRFLRTQQSLSGPIADAPIDAEAELAAVVGEIMAQEKDVKRADAVREAYRRSPDLHQRVTEARRVKAGTAKGGER
jgi:2-keto-4-pentenoate hydratase/2-oxohepta-3-ene-1,7-dioic acid hydratase in catechol pathway